MPRSPRGMSMVRAASGPYAAELRASNPKMGIPAEGPTCSPCSSQLARGRPIRMSENDMGLLCSCYRDRYVNEMRTVLGWKKTAGPSTSLRFGRDDNSISERKGRGQFRYRPLSKNISRLGPRNRRSLASLGMTKGGGCSQGGLVGG